MSSAIFERTRTVVAQDPNGPAALAALNELAKAEGAGAAREAAVAARKELMTRGDYEGVETLFTRELALATDAQVRANVLADMARFERDFRRDKAKAIDCFLKAFELDTTRMDLLEEVGAVYHAKESFEDLLLRLQEEANAAPDTATQAKWWAEMADVAFKLLDRLDDALVAANKALRLDATNARARSIAESVLLQRQRWPELADFYKARAREAQDPNEKVALLFRLAATWRDKLKDPLRTMETYEEIVAVAPNNIRIYALIDELKRDRATWQRVAEGLVREAKAAPAKNADDSALAWALAGKVYLKYLSDDVSASECYLALIKADPEMPGALKALRELSTRRNDPRILARGLADAAAGTKDKARKRDLHRELGNLYRGALAAPSLAAQAFAAALDLDPADAASAESLEALYAELGEWEALSTHLRKRIDAAPANRVPSLLARLGEVLAERLAQPAGAIEAYEEALGKEPQHRPSLLALERLYRASSQWRDLARVYRSLGETAPDRNERIRVHKSLASISIEHLHDVNGAATELEAALKLDPTDRESWESLEAAYNAGERWPELLQLYGSLPNDASFKDLARVWYRRAAELCARRMQDPGQAALWYRRARFLEPDDPALRDALAQQYQAAEAWPDLVALLVEEADKSEDADARASALLRAGVVAEEKIRSPEQARALYERAAQAAPADPSPLKALERIYLRAQAWEELSGIYAAQARIGKDVETRAAAVRRLARLERDKLKRPAKAAEAYQALAQLVPDDREAIDALRTLLSEQRRWQEVLQYHARALEGQSSSAGKAQILREMADVMRSELRDPEGALGKLEMALSLEPDHLPTLEQAAELYRLRWRWAEFIDCRVRALPHVPTADKVRVHLEIAQACQEAKPPVRNTELARAHYEQALEFDSHSREAFNGLRRLLAEEGDERGLAALAEKELALDPTPERKVDLYKMLGKAWEPGGPLGDAAKAMAYYQAAADISPDDVEALSGMRRMLAVRNAWAEYAKVAEQEAARTKDKSHAAGLHRELAKLWGERFGQAHRAATHWRKVLEIVPNDREALLGLAEALEEADDPGELDRVLARISSGESDPRERARALKSRANLAAGPLNDTDSAVKLLREATELDPDDAEALGELAKLLEKKNAWRDLLPVLTARRRLLPPGLERARTLRALGDLWRVRLGNAGSAAEAYREAMEEEPEAGTLTHLAEVVDDAEEFRADVLRARTKAEERGAQGFALGSLEAAAGRAWLERFRDPAMSAYHFECAVQADPRLPAARVGLENALEQSEQWEKLAGALEDAAEAEPPTAAQRLTRAALVARDRLQDQERAVADLCRAIEKRPEIVGGATPEDRSAREALEALYAQGKRWEALKDLYERALELSPANPTERAPLRLRLGDLYRDRFAKPDEAQKQYAHAAEEDPRNARAHESLAELAIAVGDDVNYAKHASAAADALSPHPRAAAWLRRASDASLRAGKAEDAAAFARRALALEPRDAAGLESLASALRAKAKVSGHREDWDELARTLARRLALPAAQGGRRGLLACELAAIHSDRRGDPDEAARVWERALAERASADPQAPDEDDIGRDEEAARSLEGPTPSIGSSAVRAPHTRRAATQAPLDDAATQALEDDRTVARQAAAFFTKVERWSGLAQALGRLSEVAPDAERGTALRSLSDVLATKLGDKPAAARALERLTELHPEDLPALESLARLYREGRDWEKLLAVYERAAIAAKEPRKAAETLRTLAEVWEKRLGSAEGAANAWRRLLDILPEDVEGAEGLRRCLAALGRWRELVDANAAAIAHATTGARRAELFTEIARVRRDRLDDAAGAAAAFEDMLADSDLPAELKPGALGELSDLYVDLARWKDAARIEEERARVAPDPVGAAQRLAAAATLLADRVGDIEAATHLLEHADASGADRTIVESALESLYEKAGRHEELERLLASRPASGGTRRRRAALLAGPLGRQEEALALYEEAVLADAEDADSAEALRTLARTLGARKQLKLAYDRLLALASEPSKKAALLCESAGEALRGTAKTKALEEAAAVDPRCRPAIKALRERAERRLRWAEAAEWLAKEDPLCTDASDRAEILGRRASALAKVARADGKPAAADTRADKAKKKKNVSDTTAQALALYQQALSFAPHRVDLLRAMAELAFAEEAWEDAAKAYERLSRAGAATSPEESADLARRQGEIALRRKLDDEAIAHFQDALIHTPNAPACLKPLARLYADRGQWKSATKTLKKLLENPSALDPNDRIEARLRCGEALARLGNPREAGEQFRAVLEERPAHLDATLGLAESLAATGEGAQAIVFLEKFAAETRDVDRRRDALRRVGELKAAHGDADGARTALSAAVRADHGDRRAVEALAKLHAERGEWLEVLAALSELANATPPGPQRAAVYRQIAETYDTGLGDQLKAREFYDKAMAESPGDPETERAMGTLLGRLGHWEDLAEHLKTRIEATAAGPARVDLVIERARILRDRLDQPDDAAELFRDVVDAAPERADVRRERAKALSQTGNRASEAVAEYLRLVTDDPSDLDALGGLAESAATLGEDWRATAASEALAWVGAHAADGGQKAGSWAAATGGRLDPVLVRKHLVDAGESNVFAEAMRAIEREVPEVLAAIDSDPTGPMPGLDPAQARLAEAGAALAAVLGAAEVQFVATDAELPSLILSKTPRVALPRAQASPAVLFALGRAIDALRDSRHRIVLRDSAGLQEIFAALAAATLGDGAGGPASPDLVRSIKKTFGWRTKKNLKPILEPLAGRVVSFDFVAWRAAVARTGARAGFLVCGDLAVALEQIAGPCPAERRAERLRSDAAAADLIRWALSDDYARLRGELLKSMR